MARLRPLAEVSFVEDGMEKKDLYYLLHFGLKYDLVTGMMGETVAIHYTVAICQHKETGQIEMFIPDQLKILGNEYKPK